MGAYQTTRPETLSLLEIVMNDSNYSLRFPRTYREATGQSLRSDNSDLGDKFAAWVLAMGLAFIIGLLMGASL